MPYATPVRSVGGSHGGHKTSAVRRVVRDYVAAAIDRDRPELEGYIARHLRYPEPFPLVLSDPVAAIQLASGITTENAIKRWNLGRLACGSR